MEGFTLAAVSVSAAAFGIAALARSAFSEWLGHVSDARIRAAADESAVGRVRRDVEEVRQKVLAMEARALGKALR